MKIQNFFKVILFATIAMPALLGTACNGSGGEEFEWNLTGVIIPSAGYEITVGDDLVITGKGFLNGDRIKLLGEFTYEIAMSSITATSASLSLPQNFVSGAYEFHIIRGSHTRRLGAANITVYADLPTIPDVVGKDIKGYVYAEGNRVLSGVAVSDGYTVTRTDDKGIYYLSKHPDAEFVFISIPGNYEVPTVKNIPSFYRPLAATSSVQQFDFSLTSVNNDDHVVVAAADLHLGNRSGTSGTSSNRDMTQFRNGFVTDANALIGDYTDAGKKAYILTLGDLTWDIYWYQAGYFTLPLYVNEMDAMNAPIFNTIGNHDYDCRVNGGLSTTDKAGEKPWRDNLGPTYYSFNLGKVHYVVLDNMVYINTGGTPTTNGDRNHSYRISDEQLAWLAEDLAAVTDKSTPVVVAMHVQMASISLSGLDANPSTYRLTNAAALMDCFNGFSDVRFLSGHAHTNYNIDYSSKGYSNIKEENIGAVCATWWWTGAYDAAWHLCPDGALGGYGVYEYSGKVLEHYYKGIGYSREKQFRTYDRNSIQITGDRFAPNANASNKTLLETTYGGGYNTVSTANQVLINVWRYGKGWSIEVKENGTALPVTRISAKDPIHIIAYEARRLNGNNAPTSSFLTGNTHHLFRVTASGPATTLDITVKDEYGNTFTETMTRPKAFGYESMD